MFTSGGPAHRASAIPLRNSAACSGAQDDDAKHDPSPGNLDTRKVDTGCDTFPRFRNVSRPHVHLHRDVKRSPAAYLRAAHAYMLISMPTGTSAILGAFQAILARSFCLDEFPHPLIANKLACK